MESLKTVMTSPIQSFCHKSLNIYQEFWVTMNLVMIGTLTVIRVKAQVPEASLSTSLANLVTCLNTGCLKLSPT